MSSNSSGGSELSSGRRSAKRASRVRALELVSGADDEKFERRRKKRGIDIGKNEIIHSEAGSVSEKKSIHSEKDDSHEWLAVDKHSTRSKHTRIGKGFQVDISSIPKASAGKNEINNKGFPVPIDSCKEQQVCKSPSIDQILPLLNLSAPEVGQVIDGWVERWMPSGAIISVKVQTEKSDLCDPLNALEGPSKDNISDEEKTSKRSHFVNSGQAFFQGIVFDPKGCGFSDPSMFQDFVVSFLERASRFAPYPRIPPLFSYGGTLMISRPLKAIRYSLSKNPINVIVIGAGIAGLACANELRRFGFNVQILEARNRNGGRVHTLRDSGISGDFGVDIGGSWIYNADANPITSLSRKFGLELYSTSDRSLENEVPMYDFDGSQISLDLSRNIQHGFNVLIDSLTAQSQLLRRHSSLNSLPADKSLGECLLSLLNRIKFSEKDLRVLGWHISNSEYTHGSDIKNISFLHWCGPDSCILSGPHCVLKQGVGAITDNLAKDLDIQHNRVVKVISQTSSLKVNLTVDNVDDKSSENHQADAVVITLPLGVLKSGSVNFDPPLPSWKEDAIASIGFGVVNKVVLRFEDDVTFWKETTDYFAFASKQHGEHYMFFSLNHAIGCPTIICLISGSSAEAYEKFSDEDICLRAVDILRIVFKTEIPTPLRYFVTRWGSDPFSYGSYSFKSVNSTPQHTKQLARPLDDNRIFWSGEATSENFSSTIHGAYLSGLREALRILDFYGIEKPGLIPMSQDLILKKDQLADFESKSENVPRICVFCGEGSDLTSLPKYGSLIGPLVCQDRVCFFHHNCALFCPEVKWDSLHDTWYNVYRSIIASRSITCHICNGVGATIGCHYDGCERAYHFSCATATVWDFERDDEGPIFYCEIHRIRSTRVCAFPQSEQSSECSCQDSNFVRCIDCNSCWKFHCKCPSRKILRSPILEKSELLKKVNAANVLSKRNTTRSNSIHFVHEDLKQEFSNDLSKILNSSGAFARNSSESLL